MKTKIFSSLSKRQKRRQKRRIRIFFFFSSLLRKNWRNYVTTFEITNSSWCLLLWKLRRTKWNQSEFQSKYALSKAFKSIFKLSRKHNFWNRMPIVEALVLFVFGVILPTWDVGSDIALSHSFFVQKCPLWDDQKRYNDVPTGNGKSFNLFNLWGTNKTLYHFVFQLIIIIIAGWNLVVNPVTNVSLDRRFVMVAIIVVIIQMKIKTFLTVVGKAQSFS